MQPDHLGPRPGPRPPPHFAPPPPKGVALIFIPMGGGTPPPWTPSPPPPSAQVQLNTWVLGTFFGDGEKISRRLRRTPHTVYL